MRAKKLLGITVAALLALGGSAALADGTGELSENVELPGDDGSESTGIIEPDDLPAPLHLEPVRPPDNLDPMSLDPLAGLGSLTTYCSPVEPILVVIRAVALPILPLCPE